jgi:hypothetical protein
MKDLLGDILNRVEALLDCGLAGSQAELGRALGLGNGGTERISSTIKRRTVRPNGELALRLLDWLKQMEVTIAGDKKKAALYRRAHKAVKERRAVNTLPEKENASTGE